MKYEKLTALLTTTLTPPPVISAADAYELALGADALVDWMRERLEIVTRPYRLDTVDAESSAGQLVIYAKRVKLANSREDAEWQAQTCYAFAKNVDRAAQINRERVEAQIRWIDQERKSHQRARS